MSYKLTPKQVSSVGRYYVAAELLKRGFTFNDIILDTLVCDITVKSPMGKDIIIRIKTRSKGFNNWVLKEKDESNHGVDVFYIFVSYTEDTEPLFFIVPSRIVSEQIIKDHNEWCLSTGRNREISDVRKFKLNKDSIYLNNWEIIENDCKS